MHPSYVRATTSRRSSRIVCFKRPKAAVLPSMTAISLALRKLSLQKHKNNFASVDDIAADVRAKFGDHPVGVVFPILSRNRFAICLRGIARGAKKVVLMFSYPSDEVGNTLISDEKLESTAVNPWTDVLDESKYRRLFGENKHIFTGVDYVEYYKSLILEEGAEAEILFANKPTAILSYTKHILCCDIHTRQRTKRLLAQAGGEAVYGLDDILCAPCQW